MNKLAENFEKVWEIICAVALYGIAMIFTVRLLQEWSGGSPVDFAVFTVMGITFESTKISVWIKAVTDRKWYLYGVAIGFAVISVFAGIIAVLSTISGEEETKNEARVLVQSVKERFSQEIVQLDLSISGLRKRLDSTPASYVTVAKEIQAKIDSYEIAKRDTYKRMDEETRVESKEAVQDAKSNTEGGYARVARYAGIPTKTAVVIQTIFLLFISALIELGGLLMSYLAIRKGETPSGMELPEISDGSSAIAEDTPLSPHEELAKRIFTPPERNANGLVPSFQRVKELGIPKSEYDDLIKRGILNGSLKMRKGRVYRSTIATHDDFMEVVNGSKKNGSE